MRDVDGKETDQRYDDGQACFLRERPRLIFPRIRIGARDTDALFVAGEERL